MPAGTSNLFEPALRVVHANGNPSLALEFAGVETGQTGDDVRTTTIRLHDPLEVPLHFVAYQREDVIKTRTEIVHHEKKPVVLTSYAPAMLRW